MSFDALTGVGVCDVIPAEAVGCDSKFCRCVAFLEFCFAIVFPFACPYSNSGACDNANHRTAVKSGVALVQVVKLFAGDAERVPREQIFYAAREALSEQVGPGSPPRWEGVLPKGPGPIKKTAGTRQGA